ncbi:MAG: membrane integrity-associated transporter subunit PqiC [Dechloromonas sp.]|nr:membrane integrity-associated transporter subunit PqiC [Dechloromonas sp.]
MRRLVIAAGCLLVAACYSAGKRGGDSAPAIYDLGPPVPHAGAVPGRRQLAVEVRAPLWMDSMGIEYRLAHDEPARLRDYTRARWAGPPAQLIQQRLVQQLGMRPAGQGRTRCVLRIDVDAFAQVFDDPATSRGQLLGRAQLLDSTRALLAIHEFRIEKSASSADSRGAVAALTAAVDQLANELVAWEESAWSQGKGAACSN